MAAAATIYLNTCSRRIRWLRKLFRLTVAQAEAAVAGRLNPNPRDGWLHFFDLCPHGLFYHELHHRRLPHKLVLRMLAKVYDTDEGWLRFGGDLPANLIEPLTIQCRLRSLSLEANAGEQWIHLRDFSGRRDGDFSKMAHWGLIAERPAELRLEGELPRGYWAITDRGRAWLKHQVRIPRQVCLLEGELLGFVDEQDLISVDEVDDEFDRQRLFDGADGTQHAA